MSLEEIEGRVSKITFFNPSNNYTIARIRTSKDNFVTILGNFPVLNEGEMLRVKGYWKTHDKFGEQFVVESFEFCTPDSVEEIEEYLTNGNFEGIRKPLAQKIVRKFGENTLEILDNDIDRLNEISRIGKEDLEIIKKSWKEQREFRKSVVFLQNLGINSNLAFRIFSLYGKNTEAIIKNNPFCLLEDITGFPFSMADQLAVQLGFTSSSEQRLEGGVIYIIRKFTDDGHTYYPSEVLKNECSRLLSIDYDTIEDTIYTLKEKGVITVQRILNAETGDFYDGVFLSEFYDAEVSITNHLKRLAGTPEIRNEKEVNKLLNWLEKETGIQLAEAQKKAIITAVENKVIVITGGPGTGKTTIINSILSLLKRTKKKAVLAAPTGRAAKRMAEATGQEAMTIHRLLEYNPSEKYFGKDLDDPLDADFVIIDECSMIDTILLKSLLDAVPESASLVLVGDANQLPSVGAGNVLKDIIEAGIIPVVCLNEIFRQSKESMIVINAHRINSGQMPLLNNQEFEDFLFLQIGSEDQVLKKIIELCRTELPQMFGYHSLNDIQVLAPMHKGTSGVMNLNLELQKALNYSNDEIKSGERVFKTGDKVMQSRNNYQKEIFNGDIGSVYLIDNKKKNVVVNFDGRLIKYDYPEFDELMLAYAISVHKSQGSEYPVIVMPVVKEHFRMLQRNLLYTGITRSRKMVILLGTAEMLSYAIRNNRSVKRYTYLKERLLGN